MELRNLSVALYLKYQLQVFISIKLVPARTLYANVEAKVTF